MREDAGGCGESFDDSSLPCRDFDCQMQALDRDSVEKGCQGTFKEYIPLEVVAVKAKVDYI